MLSQTQQITKKNEEIEKLRLCSHCLSKEIKGWVEDNWKNLNEESKNQILQELRDVKLKPGKCLACNNSLISENTAENIMGILEQNKIPQKTREQFKKSFFLVA